MKKILSFIIFLCASICSASEISYSIIYDGQRAIYEVQGDIFVNDIAAFKRGYSGFECLSNDFSGDCQNIKTEGIYSLAGKYDLSDDTTRISSVYLNDDYLINISIENKSDETIRFTPFHKNSSSFTLGKGGFKYQFKVAKADRYVDYWDYVSGFLLVAERDFKLNDFKERYRIDNQDYESISALAKTIGIDKELSLDENLKILSSYIGGFHYEASAHLLKPNRINEIVASGKGDCKDHSYLLYGLLSFLEYRVEYALVSAGAPQFSRPYDIDVLGVDNHIIVYLPEYDMYLDPTTKNAALGVISGDVINKSAIHLTSGKKQQVKQKIENKIIRKTVNHERSGSTKVDFYGSSTYENFEVLNKIVNAFNEKNPAIPAAMKYLSDFDGDVSYQLADYDLDASDNHVFIEIVYDSENELPPRGVFRIVDFELNDRMSTDNGLCDSNYIISDYLYPSLKIENINLESPSYTFRAWNIDGGIELEFRSKNNNVFCTAEEFLFDKAVSNSFISAFNEGGF